MNDDVARIIEERNRQMRRFRKPRPQLVEVVSPPNPVLIRADKVDRFHEIRGTQ